MLFKLASVDPIVCAGFSLVVFIELRLLVITSTNEVGEILPSLLSVCLSVYRMSQKVMVEYSQIFCSCRAWDSQSVG